LYSDECPKKAQKRLLNNPKFFGGFFGDCKALNLKGLKDLFFSALKGSTLILVD
jgi:hypothetical protein